ncbi:nucleotidyltransferase family protein [Streptomyces sp. MP131-18]|uniref:nucleotidyltransferase family protein n=1 Tax=Streptomyces sp. MP131-18 TaxID=1857892 RepID=UPI00097C730A|nr:nucleotidyltransferase family protein [Streptomyces sp. MP131-18]ONK16051.1 hypothetical protein STBA_69010 [Streptomyces sp. MP131-18]
MDLSTLYDALDVPEEHGPGRLLFSARKAHYTLPYLVLSALEHRGHPMSEAARGELGRARRRARHYEEVLAHIADRARVQVVKGPMLARHYPDGILRPQGDLDLVTDGEADLWRAVRLLTADSTPLYIGVSILGAPTRHTVVALHWPAEDPLLDPEIRVDVATAALVGDGGVFPIRPRIPEDPLAANLLALAEERLQRPFHARDIIDVHVLGTTPVASTEALVSAAAEYHLAPELGELLDHAATRLPLGHLSGLSAALEAGVVRERARRAAYSAPPAPPTDIGAALAAGTALYGMPLRPAEGRTDWDRARVHRYGDEALLLTPVGDYLLVTHEIVTQERYEAALRELDAPAERRAGPGCRAEQLS